MIRAIALSLVMLIGIGVVLPIATEYVEGGPRKYKKYKKKQRIKKYSKRWWRLYKARQARRRAILRRKRALRLRQIRLAKARARAKQLRRNRPVRRARTLQAVRPRRVESSPAVSTPNGQTPPANWRPEASTSTEVKFRVDDSRGSEIGTASIVMVGPASGGDADGGRVKTIGGMATSSLRRSVIDQMIRENGWVVNDYQKTVSGKNVYVVVGQFEGTDGRMRQKVFYFTEVNGRVYSVSTVAPSDSSERLAEESEKVIDSLVSKANNQQASLDQ